MPIPYLGEELTFYSPDGSPIAVRVWGNQFSAVIESLEGYTVVEDPESGYLQYASLSPNKSELIPNGAVVGTVDPRTLDVPLHVRTTREAVTRQAEAAHGDSVRPRWEVRREERRTIALAALDRGAMPAPPARPATGDFSGLCILVQFPDIPGTIPRQEVDDFCNQPGYTGYGNNGSAYDYFLTVSDGQLRYKNIVTAYYTARHNRSYYTDPVVDYGRRARELIVEALDDLKARGFNFTPLTSDNAGFVNALNVFYAGTRINNWGKGLWPHSSALASPYPATPGKRFSDYQITDMGTELTLRTFCHENGHMVCDFPDLYDYGNQGGGVGHYCLMCYGGSDLNPVQVSGYLKNSAGWTTKLTKLTSAMTAVAKAGRNDFLIHRKDSSEYFLLENRQRSGRDASLPDAGLTIWHVDERGSNENEQMTPTLHYELSLEQSDNLFQLERRVNGGDADDLFGAPSATTFNDTSSPNSKWWDGTASGLDIESISASGLTMSITTKGAIGAPGDPRGTWAEVGVDWGCQGSMTNCAPLTFNADGTWTNSASGGHWFRVGDMIAWNVESRPGLIYAANMNGNAMTGIMGYAAAGTTRGCFYALRSPISGGSTPHSEDSPRSRYDHDVPNNTDPVLGPVA
jgi:M6 family metalloprotease-like protein